MKNKPTPNLKPEDLKPGDILLFPPNKWKEGGKVGQIIVLLTGGEVSHAAVYRGEGKVAHAAPPYIVSGAFEALLRGEPGCYVKRHSTETVLNPVLAAVDKYADHDNPYPFFNLGVLGLLLLSNRFAKKTLSNVIFYNFALWLSVKLMKAAERKIYPGKKPMSCSQFATQCFTDAGENYDIRFRRLLIQFTEASLNANDDKDCLLNLTTQAGFKDWDAMTNELEENTEMMQEQEEQIISDFLELLEKGESSNSSVLNTVDTAKLGKVGQKLLKELCGAITGKTPASPEEALELLSTNRNYFITPEDLHVNAKNLTNVGYIDKTML